MYTYYAYYLLYIDERTSKSDKDIIMGYNINENDSNEEEMEEEKDENKNDKFINEDINKSNPDYLLSKALTCKLNYLGKYFVRYLLFEIREKKKEDKDYYKK